MYKKQVLYQQEGKRLIPVHPRDLLALDALLRDKLRLFGYTVGNGRGADGRKEQN